MTGLRFHKEYAIYGVHSVRNPISLPLIKNDYGGLYDNFLKKPPIIAALLKETSGHKLNRPEEQPLFIKWGKPLDFAAYRNVSNTEEL